MKHLIYLRYDLRASHAMQGFRVASIPKMNTVFTQRIGQDTLLS